MEVRLTPEQQQQLAELASQGGRDTDALAQEEISRYLAEEARFVEAVKLGEAALDREYLIPPASGKADRPALPFLMEIRWSRSPLKTWNVYSSASQKTTPPQREKS